MSDEFLTAQREDSARIQLVANSIPGAFRRDPVVDAEIDVPGLEHPDARSCDIPWIAQHGDNLYVGKKVQEPVGMAVRHENESALSTFADPGDQSGGALGESPLEQAAQGRCYGRCGPAPSLPDHSTARE